MSTTPDAKRPRAWRRATAGAIAAVLLTIRPPQGAAEELAALGQSPTTTFETCSSQRLLPPAARGVRGYDRWGSGAYGASRDRGMRVHLGLDFVTEANESIHAPASGVVRRIGRAYRDTDAYPLVEIETASGCMIRVLYVAPTVRVGDYVAAGQVIGSAITLTTRYEGICDHVHVEVRVRGVAVDPTNWFEPSQRDVTETMLATR